MESGPTQAVLLLVGLAAEKVIRDRYETSLPPRARPSGGRTARGEVPIWTFWPTAL
ncbi:MAG: hypothetical protein ACQESR_23640 [Planctomycetota bacterium]